MCQRNQASRLLQTRKEPTKPLSLPSVSGAIEDVFEVMTSQYQLVSWLETARAMLTTASGSSYCQVESVIKMVSIRRVTGRYLGHRNTMTYRGKGRQHCSTGRCELRAIFLHKPSPLPGRIPEVVCHGY